MGSTKKPVTSARPTREDALRDLEAQRAQLRSRIESEGIELARVMPHVRDAIGLRLRPATKRDLGIGASRVGGVPDLPPSLEWPAKERLTFEFVAQLRLADCAPFDVRAQLPPDGMLWFFRGAGVSDEGEYLSEGRVLFAAETTTLVTSERRRTWKPLVVEPFALAEMPPYPSRLVPFRDGDPYDAVFEEYASEPRHGLFLHERAYESVRADGWIGLLHLDDAEGFALGEAVCFDYEIDAAALARRDFAAVRLREGAAI